MQNDSHETVFDDNGGSLNGDDKQIKMSTMADSSTKNRNTLSPVFILNKAIRFSLNFFVLKCFVKLFKVEFECH